MLKKQLFLLIILICLFESNAQEENTMTVRIAPGLLLLSDSENLGLLLNVEPKIRISIDKVIGLRFAIALNTQKFKTNASADFFIDEQFDHAVISFIPTFDYYLNDHNYRLFVGGGVGYYVLNSIDVSRIGVSGLLEGSVKDQVGLFVRGGIESGKTRLSLEYNLIPKADIELPTDQIIGTVDNSYFGVSIGWTIGGGKSS